MSGRKRLAGWLLTVLFGCLLPAAPQAQDRPKRFDVWDIHIGDTASAIPNEYVNYACGTNGGPPALPLTGFTDFKKCRPDANGLHEVYFEYDDELEYRARALDLPMELKMYAGTTVFEFPVVASVLFDDAGRVRGERMVTDPRQQVARRRIEFWEMGNFLRQRYGSDGWKCKDLPPDEGENPVGSLFIKSSCEKVANGLHLFLSQRYLEKKGQHLIDPHSGKPQPQAFDSETRFEMYDSSVPLQASSLN